MLNQEQKDQFRLALASVNCFSVKRVEELDIDNMCEDSDVFSTGESLEHFFSSRGRKLNRQGNRPDVPYEKRSSLLGDVYVWENQQSRKGARRGNLYVMEFGNYCATYFDGEV